jgi:hydrogenase maturation factor
MSDVARTGELACAEGRSTFTCITCGDVAVPMRVIALAREDGLAECVTPDGQASSVEVGLLDAVDVGDAVLVHACVALQRLEGDEHP